MTNTTATAAAVKPSKVDKFIALIALAVGRIASKTVEGTTVSFKIAGAHNNQKGKMDADTEAPYMLLTNTVDGTEFALHPNDAKKLLAGNTVKELKLEGEAVKLPKPVKAVAAPAAKEPKLPSKRELCASVYSAMRAAGAARKDIIAKFIADHQLTMQAAATYYQNYKSGAWATVQVAAQAADAATAEVAAEAVSTDEATA